MTDRQHLFTLTEALEAPGCYEKVQTLLVHEPGDSLPDAAVSDTYWRRLNVVETNELRQLVADGA